MYMWARAGWAMRLKLCPQMGGSTASPLARRWWAGGRASLGPHRIGQARSVQRPIARFARHPCEAPRGSRGRIATNRNRHRTAHRDAQMVFRQTPSRSRSDSRPALVARLDAELLACHGRENRGRASACDGVELLSPRRPQARRRCPKAPDRKLGGLVRRAQAVMGTRNVGDCCTKSPWLRWRTSRCP